MENKTCTEGIVKRIIPTFQIGDVVDINSYPMICTKAWQSKNGEWIYDFFLCTHKSNLETNPFLNEDACLLINKEYGNWPQTNKDTICNLAIKHQIKQSDIDKKYIVVGQFEWSGKGKGYVVPMDWLEDANDIREKLIYEGKECTIEFDCINKCGIIKECGEDYLKNFKINKQNKRELKKHLQVRFNEVEKEVSKFYKNQKAKMEIEFIKER